MKSKLTALSAAIVIALLLGAPAPVVAKDAPDLAAPLPVDDRIAVRETLPNGMNLWIRRHANPAKKVSMMFHIGAGSLHETDDQRGLAHYIEHMAFNGSTNFPPDTMIKKFESIGGQFGRDVNAFTSFDMVGYMLALPDTKPETLNLGLLFFSDVAKGLLLTPEEIDKERGVIIEELRQRDAPNMRLLKKLIDLLAPGSLISNRFPGGHKPVVETATRPLFQKYYENWYRPELSTLMIVGDVDPAKTAETVRSMFSDWKASTEASPAPVTGIAPIAEQRAAVFSDADITTVSAGTSQVLEPRARKTVGDLRANMVERLAAYIGQERLTRRKQAGKAAYQDASMTINPFVAGYRIAGTSVESETKHWADSQRALFEEIRRMHLHGVLDDELARAKTAFLTSAEQAVDSAGSAQSLSILMGWIQGLGQGSKPMSQKQSLALLQNVLPTITAQEVHARFKEIFPLDAGVIAVNVPEKSDVKVDEAALLAMAKEVGQQDLAPPKSEKGVDKLLEQAPTPGTVVSESTNESLGTTKWVLSNGVVAIVKPMPESKIVSVQAHLYGGIIDEVEGTRGITALVGLAMGADRAATKRHSPAQISEYLNDKKVAVGLIRSTGSAAVAIGGPPADLEAGFELAHVLLSEPQINEHSFEAAKSELITNLEDTQKQTGQQVALRMRERMSGGDPRMVIPAVDNVKGMTREAAQAWLERLVTQSPLEVVVAGSITLERAKSLVLTYFGSLPKRADGGWELYRMKRTLKAAPGPQTDSLVVDTVSPAAVVMAGWSGVGKADPELRARLMQAGFILRARMTQEIREKRGLTYSSVAGYSMSAYDGMDQLMVQFTADPEKAESAAKIAREVVREFGEKGPLPQEVMSAQMMLHARLSAQKQMPQFWSSVLSTSTVEPSGIEGVSTFLDTFMAVDGAKVKAAVQEVIKPDRFLQVIGVPKKEEAPEKAEGGSVPAPEPAPAEQKTDEKADK